MTQPPPAHSSRPLTPPNPAAAQTPATPTLNPATQRGAHSSSSSNTLPGPGAPSPATNGSSTACQLRPTTGSSAVAGGLSGLLQSLANMFVPGSSAPLSNPGSATPSGRASDLEAQGEEHAHLPSGGAAAAAGTQRMHPQAQVSRPSFLSVERVDAADAAMRSSDWSRRQPAPLRTYPVIALTHMWPIGDDSSQRGERGDTPSTHQRVSSADRQGGAVAGPGSGVLFSRRPSSRGESARVGGWAVDPASHAAGLQRQRVSSPQLQQQARSVRRPVIGDSDDDVSGVQEWQLAAHQRMQPQEGGWVRVEHTPLGQQPLFARRASGPASWGPEGVTRSQPPPGTATAGNAPPPPPPPPPPPAAPAPPAPPPWGREGNGGLDEQVSILKLEESGGHRGGVHERGGITRGSAGGGPLADGGQEAGQLAGVRQWFEWAGDGRSASGGGGGGGVGVGGVRVVAEGDTAEIDDIVHDLVAGLVGGDGRRAGSRNSARISLSRESGSGVHASHSRLLGPALRAGAACVTSPPVHGPAAVTDSAHGGDSPPHVDAAVDTDRGFRRVHQRADSVRRDSAQTDPQGVSQLPGGGGGSSGSAQHSSQHGLAGNGSDGGAHVGAQLHDRPGVTQVPTSTAAPPSLTAPNLSAAPPSSASHRLHHGACTGQAPSVSTPSCTAQSSFTAAAGIAAGIAAAAAAAAVAGRAAAAAVQRGEAAPPADAAAASLRPGSADPDATLHSLRPTGHSQRDGLLLSHDGVADAVPAQLAAYTRYSQRDLSLLRDHGLGDAREYHSAAAAVAAAAAERELVVRDGRGGGEWQPGTTTAPPALAHSSSSSYTCIRRSV
ncbi:MAG: hypothetical protein WDW38_010496 [Sanguina aurantia]